MQKRRRVALLSVDHRLGKPDGWFNFGIRRIHAALQGDPRMSDREIVPIDLAEPDVEQFVSRVEECEADVVGMSAYVWSFPALLDVARRLKARRPERRIVFGGPSARPAMFDLEPHRGAKGCVDAVVLGEGEEVFGQLLDAWDRGNDPASVSGLALPYGRGWTITGPQSVVADLDGLPSPYRAGMIPAGVRACLETFRGCPLACAFCEWGVFDKSLRVFSADYLEQEMMFLREAGPESLFLLDPALNLSARAFRNLREAERRVGLLARTRVFSEIYATSVTEEHLEFLSACRLQHLGIGLQSYDPLVLSAMRRPFDDRRFDSGVRRLIDVAGPEHCSVEVILGLPGDSPASFRRTLERAREFGCWVDVFHCLVLPDGLMTRPPEGTAMEFDPFTLRMKSCTGWSAENLVREREYLFDLAAAEGEVHFENDWSVEAAHQWGIPGHAVRRRPDRIAPAAPAIARQKEFLQARFDLRRPEGWRFLQGAEWRLTEVLDCDSGLELRIATPESSLILQIRPASLAASDDRIVESFAFRCQTNGGQELSPRALEVLDGVVGALSRLGPELVPTPAG